MTFPKPPLSLLERDSLAALELFDALADRRHGLSTFQSVEQRLIAGGILDDDFSPTINREDHRSFVFLEPANVILEVALKLGYRTNFAKVDHNAPPSPSTF